MEKDIIIPTVGCIILALFFIFVIKLDAIYSVIIGLAGFGIAYYLMHNSK